ncbi:hypothetical protein HYC85_027528 [Camellia sinensis]|uniref:Protein KAKU4 n=1 Tax=Camellia sinensis TaxID=4442 RepID=A0A7J7G6P6_CAMSI|nr:hypothetical protein HYC85_027528 [Camellia sinensis]
MASISRTRRTTTTTGDRSAGGKILRNRRIAAPKTPYDRPTPAPTPSSAPPQNPNWLSGLIFPTSRLIATGATKLLSSVFGPDTSSSSSSSGSCPSSEDDIDDDNDNYHIQSDGVDELNKKNGTTSELIGCFRKEPRLTLGKSETKHVIETLLMQETFSSIFDSRDLCSKAVMEAKQWLEEKKVASSSKLDLDHGICALNSVVLPQVTKGGLGSPVDMAKWYMQARPPWASPSKDYVEFRTPSPMGREILKEETPLLLKCSLLIKGAKMYSLASGSWNIQEEIRRVRSKATEDMLKTPSSTKIDMLSFALEPKSFQKSLLSGKTELGRGDKVNDLNLLPATKSIDVSSELVAGVTTCQGLPVSVVEMTQDSLRNADLSSQPVMFSSAQNQDSESIWTVEGEEPAASKSPNLALEQDLRSSDKTCSNAKEETESRGKQNANGFPYSGYSSFAGDTKANPRPSDDKNHDKLANKVPPGEETCKLLCEASVDVPVLYETNSVASGSDHSSSMPREELSQELNPERSLMGETTNMVEKQQGRYPSRHNRKSRGRGQMR